MADIYLRSTDGADGDDGSTWALAKALLSAALTASVAGGRIFMSDNHSESTAGSITTTSPGTSTSWLEILCVDDTGDPVPPTALATTGVVATSGAANISHAGYAAAYGYTDTCASGGSAGNIQWSAATSFHWVLRSYVMFQRGTGGSSRNLIGGQSTTLNEVLVEMYACDVQFSAVGQAFQAGNLKWFGGSLLLGTAPTGGLIKSFAGMSTLFEARGVDLTNLGTNPILEVGTGAPGAVVDLIHCKLNSSQTALGLKTGAFDGYGEQVRAIQCKTTDTNVTFNLLQVDAAGTVESFTSGVRTGGATDKGEFLPGTPYCHKMVGVNNTFYQPVYSPRYPIPISSVGSGLTLTVELFADRATNLTDQDVFVELEYPGTSGNTLAVFSNSRGNPLATATDLTSSAASWTVTATNPQARKITIAFTPQETGVAFVRVGLILAGGTIYVDPPQRAQVA